MQITSRAYVDEHDYFRVRDFLIRLHGLNGNHHSWGIERWDYWVHFVYWLRYSNRRYDPANEKGWVMGTAYRSEIWKLKSCIHRVIRRAV